MVEVIRDGEYGFLIPPDDVEGLIAALRPLIANPAQRAAFGQAARQAYETRFSLPVVVAHTEQEFRRVIAQHQSKQATFPSSRAVEAQVREGLAQVIARSTGLDRESARRAAERLLDPVAHPVDFFAPLAQLAACSDNEFAVAAFRVLHGRDPSPEDAAHYKHLLYTLRGDRRELVRQYLAGWEPRHHGVPPELAHKLHLVLPPAPPLFGVPTPPETRPVPKTARGRLSTLPLAGKLLKYTRRALMLPWNFHKFYTGYGQSAVAHHAALGERVIAVETAIDHRVLPLIRELAEKTDQLRAQIADRDYAVMAAQRELRAALDERMARLSAAPRPESETHTEATSSERTVMLPRWTRAAG
jgi:hypothetical protein